MFARQAASAEHRIATIVVLFETSLALSQTPLEKE